MLIIVLGALNVHHVDGLEMVRLQHHVTDDAACSALELQVARLEG